jgi:hypothetical protein
MEKTDSIYEPHGKCFIRYAKEYDTCSRYQREIYNHWTTSAKDIIKFSRSLKSFKFDLGEKIKENNNIQEKKIKENNNIQEKNNIQFWNIINNLQWYDRDEGMIDNITRQDILENKLFIFSNLESYFIPELKITLINLPIRTILNESEYNNFISHIVFKGTQFYNAVTESPDLCLYLLYNYHPVYNWVRP